MPPPRPITEARSGALSQAGRAGLDQPIRAIQPAGCAHHPRLDARDRQTDVRRPSSLNAPLGVGIINTVPA